MKELTYEQILAIILTVDPKSKITFSQIYDIKYEIEKIINQ